MKDKRFETYEKNNGRYVYLGWYYISPDNIQKIGVRKASGKKYLYVDYKYIDGQTATYKYVMDLDDRISDYIKEC